MLEIFICAKTFFRQVSNWKVVNIGARSDNSAVQVKFQITAINLKVKWNVKLQVDWTTIGENVKTNDLFNVNLFQMLPKEPTYTQFNQCIFQADIITDVTTKR